MIPNKIKGKQIHEEVIVDDLDNLLAKFPDHVREQVKKDHTEEDFLVEIVMDLGRPLEVRYLGSTHYYEDIIVTKEDLEKVTSSVGDFGGDNRAGIERTLHRISCIRNRKDEIVGLTCRVGRTVKGAADMIQDLITSGRSILMLGRPGSSKTTKLREVARILADDLNKRVVIIDTSNEIAGDGDIPHDAIGKARRMQVKTPSEQHAVMIEAVENHMPEVIIIDEISTAEEAMAARTIAERGVQLIGTAHGSSIENIIINPTLNDLVGGIESVTLGDEEAKRRGTQKAVLERKSPPTFEIAVEIQDWHEMAIHIDVSEAVDQYLRNSVLLPEVRYLGEDGKIHKKKPVEADYKNHMESVTGEADTILKVFPYAVSRSQLDRTIKTLRLPLKSTKNLNDADVLLILKSYSKNKKILRAANERQISVEVVESNKIFPIQKALRKVLHMDKATPEEQRQYQEMDRKKSRY